MAIMLMQPKLFCLQVDSYFSVFKELFHKTSFLQMEYCSLSPPRSSKLASEHSCCRLLIVFPIPYAFSSVILDQLGSVSALVLEGFDSCLCKSHLLGVFSCFVLQCPICIQNLSHQVFWLDFDRAQYEFFSLVVYWLSHGKVISQSVRLLCLIVTTDFNLICHFLYCVQGCLLLCHSPVQGKGVT